MSTEELPAGDTAAEARGIRHRYKGAEPALRGIDATVERGAITALVGANGAGKTTLLRVLAGILEPDAGEVRVLGTARPAALGPRAARELRRRVAYLSQDLALDPEMTGGEVLTLVAALYGVGRRARRRQVSELAEIFGFASHLGRRIDTWSGGLRRRLHLAAGMIQDPELLCLDEPTAGLDPEGRDFLWAELERRAATGRAVAVVTHDLAAVARHARAVCILDGGRIAAAGRPEELVGPEAPSLEEVYLKATGQDPKALRTPPHGRRKDFA